MLLFVFMCFFPLSVGNEGNIFQIDEETGNITMTKAADIVGPITLTILVKQILYTFIYIKKIQIFRN